MLKEYLLKGYAVNQRFERIEQQVSDTNRRLAKTEEKVDFFVKTALPPVEGIFYDSQIFDAYTFAADFVKSAKKSLVLIDNYIDETVLMLLSKRKSKVDAVIYTPKISQQLQLDIQKHNAQYPPVAVKTFKESHDRFLIIDDTVYHIGASLKDLGKKWFANLNVVRVYTHSKIEHIIYDVRFQKWYWMRGNYYGGLDDGRYQIGDRHHRR